MLDQNDLFRSHALGSFHELLRDVTIDPAMLMWLNGIENRAKRDQRELRPRGHGAVHARRGPRRVQRDRRRELAKALTGWRADWVDGVGYTNFRFDPNRFDGGTKTLFAGVSGYGPKVGNFGWQDAVRLCVEHPLHPSFLVEKLWSYFIPTPPLEGRSPGPRGATTSSRATASGPVVEAILLHPDLYKGPRMVKPPAVCARSAAAMGRYIDRESGGGSATTPASSSSARPTSRAGTTPAGSTPAQSADAGTWRRGAERPPA